MKIQLKYILPYSVQTSPDFFLSEGLSLSSLKNQISDIFNVSPECQLLKIFRDSYFVKPSFRHFFSCCYLIKIFVQIRISDQFPLEFYELNENDIIYIQDVEQLMESNNNIEFQRKKSPSEDEENEMDFREYIKFQMNFLLEVVFFFHFFCFFSFFLFFLISHFFFIFEKKECSHGNLEKIKNILKEIEERKEENNKFYDPCKHVNYLNEIGLNGFNAIHMAVLSGHEHLLDYFYEKLLIF